METVAGSCYAAILVNESGLDVEIQVEHEGMALDVAHFARIPHGSGAGITYDPLLAGGRLPADEVAILFLSGVGDPHDDHSVSCPVDVGVAMPIEGASTVPSQAVNGVVRSSVFNIRTSAPVTSYDVFPYGGGSTALTSATLLLPTSTWGTQYVGVSGYPGYQPWLSVVAQDDDTRIEFIARTDLTTEHGTTFRSNQPASVHLQRNEVLRLFAAPDPDPAAEGTLDLSGMAFSASGRVGVWGGVNLGNIPKYYAATDCTHQQIPAVSALGSEYVGARYRSRYEGNEEAPPWTLVGVVADGARSSGRQAHRHLLMISRRPSGSHRRDLLQSRPGSDLEPDQPA